MVRPWCLGTHLGPYLAVLLQQPGPEGGKVSVQLVECLLGCRLPAGTHQSGLHMLDRV